MKNLTLPILFVAIVSFSGHAQQTPAQSEKMVLTGETVAQYVDGLVGMDQARLKLTPQQATQAKVVLTDYAVKYNKQSKTPNLTPDQLSANLRQLDAERIHRYKAFLTAAQYKTLVTSYNKSHPKTPLK